MDSGSSSAPSKRLEGKVAIITGGASGIGAAAVQLFHKNGAKVVIADVQDKIGQAIADKLGDSNVCYIHCDVSNENDIINLVDTTAPSMQLKMMVHEKINKGCILFTASACTEIGGLCSPAYGVSKYGILGLVKNLAAELGQYGIRVNCVSPYGLVTGISGNKVVDPAIIEAKLSEMGNLRGEVLKAEGIANAASTWLAMKLVMLVAKTLWLMEGSAQSILPL
ncbi:hypothetical protein LWI28_021654 [Acer negundo]|uniref:Uncharacterized protein n=1 Tax=Acer negundo TaxID=4023 RepID=A0AAD5I739_ACENE|nr:hypothetical protein LWI28_021654 [Acer negundo]